MLQTQESVQQIHVDDPVVKYLIQHKYLELRNERRCGIVRMPCADIILTSTFVFNELIGRTYYYNDSVILGLVHPIVPNNVEITGVVSRREQRLATVEFAFSYVLPAALADLPQALAANCIKISGDGRMRGRKLVGQHTGVSRFQLYDDGWRLVDWRTADPEERPPIPCT